MTSISLLKELSCCFEDNACYKYFAPDGAMMGSWLSRGPGVYAAAVFDGSLDWLNMRSMTTAQDLSRSQSVTSYYRSVLSRL